MNIYLVVILLILLGEYFLDLVVEILNVRSVNTRLPQEFQGYYDEDKYRQSQRYLKENTYFGMINKTVFTVIVLAFILTGGFNYVDKFARSFDFGYILTGLIFTGVLVLGTQILNVPFSIYHTFVIEEKYGFNRMTVKTFILDMLKSGALTMVIGGIVFSSILWFFEKTGGLAWVYCWAAVTLFQLFLIFIAPVVIMPLFNKFIPLEEGELKEAIETYAASENFKMKGLFKMDGSRRSNKSNAFFTGFGKYRRIVLFDTLIAKHTVGELVSVLAHEMGHYKKNHILKNIIAAIFTGGVMFFILSLFINNPGLFSAFRMEQVSIYAGLLFFGFLYSPINMFFSIAGSALSRKHEYQADEYAVTTYRNPTEMISALKKLSVDNLSNLTPHPLKVFLEYSHPPVLNRIQAIRGKMVHS